MTTNQVKTIVPDVAPLRAKEKTKKRVWQLKSYCTTTIMCPKHTYSIHINSMICWKEHLEATLKMFYCYPSFTHPKRGATTSGFRHNTFFSVCLEIIKSGSIGVYLSRLKSSQMVVVLSSTICPDTQFAWNILGMPPHLSFLSKIHSQYLNLVLTFMSFTALPQFCCLLLCIAAHFYCLSCLHPFCMCEHGSLFTRAS